MEIKTSRHPLINTLIHTRLVRKPSSLREIEEFSRHILNRTAVLITEVWELTAAEYSDFGNSCLKSRPEFCGKGGYTQYQGKPVLSVIALCCHGKPTLLINPEGYDYARYIGLLDKI